MWNTTSPGRCLELAENMPDKANVGTDGLWRVDFVQGIENSPVQRSAHAGASIREMLHECAHAARASL